MHQFVYVLSKITTILFILNSSNFCYSQKNVRNAIYIEKLGRNWNYSNANDSLIINNYVISGDTLKIKVFLQNNYGSYTLTIINKNTKGDTVICYKGNKKNFKITKMMEIDENGNFKEFYYEKIYYPILATKCKQ